MKSYYVVDFEYIDPLHPYFLMCCYDPYYSDGSAYSTVKIIDYDDIVWC